MRSVPRHIIQVTRRVIPNVKGGALKWAIMHFTYTDGSEEYRVRSVDGDYPAQRFRLRTEMEAWLRKRGYQR